MATRIALSQVNIAEPCPADWAQMVGDDQQRFCGLCQRQVHDLSAMSADNAQQLLCTTACRLCVQYQPTPDGHVQTLDDKPATLNYGKARHWHWAIWVALASIAAGPIGYASHRLFRTPASSTAAPPMVVGMIAMPMPAGNGSQCPTDPAE